MSLFIFTCLFFVFLSCLNFRKSEIYDTSSCLICCAILALGVHFILIFFKIYFFSLLYSNASVLKVSTPYNHSPLINILPAFNFLSPVDSMDLLFIFSINGRIKFNYYIKYFLSVRLITTLFVFIQHDLF